MAETFREKLHRIDLKCIDENLKYHDLRNLFEAVAPKLSPQDKEEIKKVIQNTDDAETIAAVLQAKAMDKNENLQEDSTDQEEYEVFIYGQNRRVKKPLAYFNSEVEAEDFCNDHDWEYTDPETRFVWKMDYRISPKQENDYFLRRNGSLEEKLVDAPQEVVDELINILNKYGFVLDDSFKVNPGKTFMGDTHMQVINPESLVDMSDEIDIQDQLQKYVTQDLIDEIHDLDQKSDCPITWNFGPNNKGQITGGLDIMKQYVEESLKEDFSKDGIYDFLDAQGGYSDYNQKIEDVMDEFNLDRDTAEGIVWDWASAQDREPYAYDDLVNESLDLSDYEELTYPLRDGGKNYQLFRKLENGKGKWAAAPVEMGEVKYGDAFEITYDQARGFEPINAIGKLSRDLGKVLLPKRESLDESWDSSRVVDLVEYCYDRYYDLDKTFKLVKHQMQKEGSVLPENDEELKRSIYNAWDELEEYHSYDESLNEASYGGAYDIEDDMYFTKEDMMEFIDELIQKLKDEFGYDFEIYTAGFDTPNDLYIELIDDHGALVDNHVIIDMRRIKTPADLINKYLDSTFKMFKDDFQDVYEDYNSYESSDGSKKVSFDIIVDDEHFTLNDEEADWALEDISAVHISPSDVAVYESTADADYFILTLKDGTKKAWYIHSGMYIPDKEFNESLDDEEEYTDFIKNNINSNKNFDYKKYGKYFDKEGKLIPELEDEYTNLIKTSNLNEDYFRNIEKEVRDFTHDYELDYGEFVPSKFNADYLNDLFDELQSKGYTYSSIVKDHSKPDTLDNYTYTFEREKELDEDTVKTSKGKWVNKGKEGTHGEFATKKAADVQRKAMFANGFKESYQEIDPKNYDKYRALLIINHEGGNSAQHLYDLVMKYQPDAEEPDDMTDETIEKVYDELVSKYKKELDKYGDDAEVDYVAIKALKLEEKFLTKRDLQAARLILKTSINPKEIAAAQNLIKEYNKQQEEIKNESLNEEEEYYTHLIDEDDTADINEFVNAVEIKKAYDLVDNKVLIDSLYNKYVFDYKKFPRSSSRDSLDQKYSKDHGRFYTKWKNVIDKCKDIVKNYHVTGYGKLDYIVIKLLDELKAMEYNFPYGWKYDVNESLTEDYSVGYVKGHPYNQDMIYSVSIEGPYDNRDGEKYNHVNLTLVCGKDYVDSYEYDGQAWVDAEQFVDDVQFEVLVWYPESESLNDVFEENEYVKCGLPHTIWHYDEEKDTWHREYTNESLKEGKIADNNMDRLDYKSVFTYLNNRLINGVNIADIDINRSNGYKSFLIYLSPDKYNNGGYGYGFDYIPKETSPRNFLHYVENELNDSINEVDEFETESGLDINSKKGKKQYSLWLSRKNAIKYGNESLNELYYGDPDFHRKANIISQIVARYPDISQREEDYLGDLPYDELVRALKNRGLSFEEPENESLKEDYQHKDDEWGDPYTYDEVERELKKITNDFTVEGTIRCYWEQEKEFGEQILSQHFEKVESSDGRTGPGEDMSWVISYSRPKEELKESLSLSMQQQLRRYVNNIIFWMWCNGDKLDIAGEGSTCAKTIADYKKSDYSSLSKYVMDHKQDIFPKDDIIRKIDEYAAKHKNSDEIRKEMIRFYDDYSEKDFTRNLYLKRDDPKLNQSYESLNESVTSNLQDKIIDCLDYFIEMEMEFPKDKFLADSWEDVKDGIQMGIDPEFEVAEGIVEYLKPIITFNKKYNKEVGEEGVFQDEIEMYQSLVRAMNNYLAKNGYEPNIK